MNSTALPLPRGYHSLNAYITVSGAAAALDFYARAFGATEIGRYAGPDGTVGHAEIRLGDSVLMLSDEFPDYGARSPKTLGGATSTLMLMVDDADAAVARAVEAGATLLEPVDRQFYGARQGKVLDPFGHKWILATFVEQVPPEELDRRARELFGMPYVHKE